MKKMVIVFVGGFLWETVLTLDMVAVANDSVLMAGITSWTITMLAVKTSGLVYTGDGADRRGTRVLAIASAAGAMFGMLCKHPLALVACKMSVVCDSLVASLIGLVR